MKYIFLKRIRRLNLEKTSTIFPKRHQSYITTNQSIKFVADLTIGYKLSTSGLNLSVLTVTAMRQQGANKHSNEFRHQALILCP